MNDFLAAYSSQNWLEACPQVYLEGTVYGHLTAEGEPDLVLENPALREQAIRTNVLLVVGERCALAPTACSSSASAARWPHRRA